VGEEEVVG
jgi:hypothetical protein